MRIVGGPNEHVLNGTYCHAYCCAVFENRFQIAKFFASDTTVINCFCQVCHGGNCHFEDAGDERYLKVVLFLFLFYKNPSFQIHKLRIEKYPLSEKNDFKRTSND